MGGGNEYLDFEPPGPAMRRPGEYQDQSGDIIPDPPTYKAPDTSGLSASETIASAISEGSNFVPGRTPAATGYKETEEATDTLAQLTRDQWEYYKRVGVPIEDALFRSYRNEDTWDRDIQDATDATNNQFSAARGILDREQSRYGQGLSARQTEAADRQMGLSKAAALVTNRNNARKMMEETDNAVMTGSNTQQVTLKSLMG